ncbi:conjugal transfer protein TraO [Klebsiella aerogenes]
MALENDAGRDLKKLGLLGGLVMMVLIGVYLLFAWLNRPAPATSHISINKAATGSSRSVKESPEYRTLLDKYNQEHAAKAAETGSTYIASVHTDTIPVAPPPAAPHTAPPAPRVTPAKAQQVYRQGIDPDRKKAVDNLLKQLAVQWTPAEGQFASAPNAGGTAVGNGQQNAATPASNGFSGWTRSLNTAPAGMTGAQATVAVAATSDRVIIPAGQRISAVIDNFVDSDNRRSRVTAHVPAGQYAGAVFLSQDVQPAGDGVSIHFTEMSWNKVCYSVDVWAEQQGNLAGNIATSVDHHYWSRIVVPAVAHGVGNAGRLYEDANTQILSNEYGEITANVEEPDGKAVAGTIVGGIADKAGQVIERDAAKTPATQVTVDRNEPVSLLFMKPVRDSDNIEKHRVTAPAQTVPATPAAVPVATPVSATATAPTPVPSTYRRGFPRRSDYND